MRHQAQCKEPQHLGLAPGRYPWNWVRPYRAPSVATDVGSSGTCNVPALREGKGSSRGSRGPWQKPRPKSQGNWGHQSADGARHGGLAPESLGDLETRESSGGLLVVVLIDSGASTNFARRQMIARNGDKYADALRESEGRSQVSVRLADGTVVNVPGFEDFDSTESFLVLDMDKYDLILGMPWLEKHEPWIDWRGKAIGASRPAVSDRALVSNVPTSVRDWGARDGRQGAYAPDEVLGVTDSNKGVAMSLVTGHETKAHCQACGIATTASPNAKSRRAEWASTVAVPDGTDQAGNIGPQAAEAAKESAKGVSCVGNIGPQVGNIGPQAGNVVPQAGNIGPQAAEAAGEGAEGASGVGNIVPHEVEETEMPSSPTFYVRKPNGKWRLVHAYNKLNNATVPAQMPIPRKDVLLNNMSGCTLYSALDLVDGYYQILMRESDIPLTAVSTPSGKLWEWLVMSQGLSNAPATFNRLVTQLFRPLSTFAQTRAEGGQTAMEVHLKHLRREFEVLRANKIYINVDKCVFAAQEINVLGCFVSRVGVRADPTKVK
ncbi:LOW QUALITY PROTEIN: Reverse transcriptase, partial [Phytophthora palmivora]